jgi:hypothetical protein
MSAVRGAGIEGPDPDAPPSSRGSSCRPTNGPYPRRLGARRRPHRDGYDDNIYDYDNDLFVRDLIEALLHDDRLRDVEPMRGFRERVGQIDTRFRALLTGQPVGARRAAVVARVPAAIRRCGTAA